LRVDSLFLLLAHEVVSLALHLVLVLRLLEGLGLLCGRVASEASPVRVQMRKLRVSTRVRALWRLGHTALYVCSCWALILVGVRRGGHEAKILVLGLVVAHAVCSGAREHAIDADDSVSSRVVNHGLLRMLHRLFRAK